MSTELFVTPPHPLSHLPVLIPPPSPVPPSFTTKDFLLTFPSHAATVMRSHRHHISSHQRSFHTRRLLRSVVPFLSSGSELTEMEVARRVDDVCDTLLATLKPAPQHELILTIVCVAVQPHTGTAAAATADPSSGTCFVAHARFTSPFPTYAPLVTCLLQPTPGRYLPIYKHSQWIRDRAPLEALKQSHDCGELIMCDDGGTDVREGLITNVLVEDGGVVRGCRRSDRLLGYFESILDNSSDGDGGGGGAANEAVVSVAALKAGRYDSVFITGTSVCIAAVAGVKWLTDGTSGAGQSCEQQQYSEASIRRVEAARLRMLATLDRHIAEDEQRRTTNGV